MAIRTEKFADFGDCDMYQVVDDRGQPTRPERWRTTAIRVVNNSAVTSYFAYVYDSATNSYYPAPDPNNPAPEHITPPLTTREWAVPPQFQGNTPDDYSWGARSL